LPHSLLPEGAPRWTSSCAGHWLPYQAIGLAQRLEVITVITADDNRRTHQRDKLTIAEVCADLGISRRTFYEWRAKNRAPKCIALPNGSFRIRRSEYQRWLSAHEEAA
jgi:excisionase family DNA binding protein